MRFGQDRDVWASLRGKQELYQEPSGNGTPKHRRVPRTDRLRESESLGNIYGMDTKTLQKRIKELLELFGLTEFKDKKVATFSGGMKRSVNLMVGIMHKPELLILDEPTVGIDVQSKVVILDSLKKLNREGVTILYTSHDLEEAQRLCTRVGIIDGGKLVAEDTPEKLMDAHPGCNDLEAVYLCITGRKLRNMED